MSKKSDLRRDKSFLDTNILVYAHDSAENRKKEIARQLIRELFKEGFGAISTQVLQEFYVAVTGKIQKPLGISAAQKAIEKYGEFYTVHVDEPLIQRAINLHRREEVSFWDALVIAAAGRVDCRTLYSEDLNHGQKYGSVEVVNPFLTD